MPIKPDGAADAAPSEADSQPTWIEVDSSLAPPALQPALRPPLPPLAWRWFLPLPFCLLGLALCIYGFKAFNASAYASAPIQTLLPSLLCSWVVCFLRRKATLSDNLRLICLSIPIWLLVAFASFFCYAPQGFLFSRYGVHAGVLLFLSLNVMLLLVYLSFCRANDLKVSALFLFFLSLCTLISPNSIFFYYYRGY